MMWIDIYQVTVKVRLIHADLQPFLQYLRQIQFQFLFVRRFILVLTKFSFPEEGKGMGNNSMELWDFPDISFFSCVGILPASRRKFAKILSRDAQTTYTSLSLIITLRFTCYERKIYLNIKFQHIMNMVVVLLWLSKNFSKKNRKSWSKTHVWGDSKAFNMDFI